MSAARMKRDVRSYNEAIAFLDGTDFKRIGHNTWLSFFEGSKGLGRVSVILHKTAVVTFHEDGAIVLLSGGYDTPTTKARINTFLPPAFGVYQHKHRWFLTRRSPNVFGLPAARASFYDGIFIKPSGLIDDEEPGPDGDRRSHEAA